MKVDFVIPALLVFAITVVIGPAVIRFLQRLKAGQPIREEGVQAHLSKAGTPTMGGMMFLLPILVVSFFYMPAYPKLVPIVIVTLGFGLVGFADDFLKVVFKQSDGLKPLQKMGGQALVTALFAFYLIKISGVTLDIIIPFTNGKLIWQAGWWSIPLLIFILLGTTNGANFTDGLDGLAVSVTLPITVYFLVADMARGAGITPMAGMMFGGLLGFLVYNVHPAKVFMGDTGSLAIGGFVAGTAYVLQQPLHLAIIALIYVLEILSVIIQVGYFKISHGKRIFKMAPLHHHFELCGFKETKVVSLFMTATIILCLLAMLRL